MRRPLEPLNRQFAEAVRQVITEDGLSLTSSAERNSSRTWIQTRQGKLWVNVYPLTGGWNRATIYVDGSKSRGFEYDFRPWFGRWLPWGIKRKIRKYLISIHYIFLDFI